MMILDLIGIALLFLVVVFILEEYEGMREEGHELKEKLEDRVLMSVSSAIVLTIIIVLFGDVVPMNPIDLILGALILSLSFPLKTAIERRFFD